MEGWTGSRRLSDAWLELVLHELQSILRIEGRIKDGHGILFMGSFYGLRSTPFGLTRSFDRGSHALQASETIPTVWALPGCFKIPCLS